MTSDQLVCYELRYIVVDYNIVTIEGEYHIVGMYTGGLRAAKGGSVVGLGSVEREGPAGGRCPRVYDQLPDG